MNRMERLHFGARARRKAQRQRWLRWAALASFVLMAAGVSLPWTIGGFGSGSLDITRAGVLSVGRVPQEPFAPDTFEHKSASLNDDVEDRLARERREERRKARLARERRQERREALLAEASAPEETTTTEAVETVEPAPAPAGSISEIIYAAAARHGVDGGYLLSIAQCESGLNPGAVNAAGYYGLFQFSESTWAAYGSGSIYDPYAQSDAAARMIAAGGSGHWPNCG